MYKKIVIFIVAVAIVLNFTACSASESENIDETQSTLSEHLGGEILTADGSNPSESSSIRSSTLVNPYQALLESSLSHRVNGYRLFEELVDKEVLSGADLNNLHLMSVDHLNLKDEIAGYASVNQFLVDDASGYAPKVRMQLIMVSLSAMLLRYDNYLVTYSNYNNNTKLREVLNDPNSSYNIPRNTLKDILDTYNSMQLREDVKKMLTFYDENIASFEDVEDSFFVYLKMFIDQSPSRELGFDLDTEYGLDNLNSLYTATLDLGNEGLTLVVSEISKLLGNSAGLVETRKGKLYEDEAVAQKVKLALRAGDILLEKTPFRLTDQLIPGHWGHAAVFVGTAKELQDLGIWNHEVVVPFQEQILAGATIDEALRDDVQLNSVEHFLNVDDLVIMRDMLESDEDKIERIILTLRQLGKEYDFYYDIESSDKIVCSELVYATSIKIDWETEELVGINTISPDNIAIKTIEEGTRFDIVMLYHDGIEITESQVEKMRFLLEDAKEEE